MFFQVILVQPNQNYYEYTEGFFALPSNTISANPTLEPCSIEGIFLCQPDPRSVELQLRSYHSDTLNPSRVISMILTFPVYVNYVQNILNIHCITLAHGANGKSVTTITVGIVEVDVVRWGTKHQAIVSVENDIVFK